jgi:hypothetical protein
VLLVLIDCHDVARLGIKLAILVGFFSSISDSKSLPNGSRLGVTLRVTLRSRAFCTHFAKHLVNTKDEQMLRSSFTDTSSCTEMNDEISPVARKTLLAVSCHHDSFKRAEATVNSMPTFPSNSTMQSRNISVSRSSGGGGAARRRMARAQKL